MFLCKREGLERCFSRQESNGSDKFREVFLSETIINTNLLSGFVYLLQEFEDVFLSEVPSGLLPLRGIQH